MSVSIERFKLRTDPSLSTGENLARNGIAMKSLVGGGSSYTRSQKSSYEQIGKEMKDCLDVTGSGRTLRNVESFI